MNGNIELIICDLKYLQLIYFFYYYGLKFLICRKKNVKLINFDKLKILNYNNNLVSFRY